MEGGSGAGVAGEQAVAAQGVGREGGEGVGAAGRGVPVVGQAVLVAGVPVAVDDRVEGGEQGLAGFGGEQPVQADAPVGQLTGGQAGALALPLLLLGGELAG